MLAQEHPLLKMAIPYFSSHTFAESVLCHFLRRRLSLPALDPVALFPAFDEQVVTLRKVPRGEWSTPLQDIFILFKLAACAKPKRLLEVGSFRGYTALGLLQHADPAASLVTIDHYPEHGEAYRDTPWGDRIERRVGDMSPSLLAADRPGSYDFIFVDANHSYASVKHDTELILPLVAPGGFIVWHDYANWGYFNGTNGVPEYLSQLSATLPLARISGSSLALHSPAWKSGTKREIYLHAVHSDAPVDGGDPWKAASFRG